jgi:hypothetical protein
MFRVAATTVDVQLLLRLAVCAGAAYVQFDLVRGALEVQQVVLKRARRQSRGRASQCE